MIECVYVVFKESFGAQGGNGRSKYTGHCQTDALTYMRIQRLETQESGRQLRI